MTDKFKYGFSIFLCKKRNSIFPLQEQKYSETLKENGTKFQKYHIIQKLFLLKNPF